MTEGGTLSSLTIEPIYVIVCDDIRTESNGKDIFIGVYTGDIVIGKVPGMLNLCFWVDAKTTGTGERAFEYRVVLEPDDIQIARIGATLISTPDADSGSFAFGGIIFQVQRPGALSVQFKQSGEEWREIMRKKIIVNRDSSSTETKQPS